MSNIIDLSAHRSGFTSDEEAITALLLWSKEHGATDPRVTHRIRPEDSELPRHEVGLTTGDDDDGTFVWASGNGPTLREATAEALAKYERKATDVVGRLIHQVSEFRL